MFSGIRKMLEKKSSNAGISNELAGYLNAIGRSNFSNWIKTDHETIVNKVFEDRYNVYANTQPLRLSIEYIALGLQNIPIKLMRSNKNRNKADEVIGNKKDVLKCNFENPSSIYNPTIDSLLHSIVKEYYLNGSYCIYYDKSQDVFYCVPSNQYSLNKQDNYGKVTLWIEFRNKKFQFDVFTGSYVNVSNDNEMLFVFDKDPWVDCIKKSMISSIAVEISLYNMASMYSIDAYQNSGANVIISSKGGAQNNPQWKSIIEHLAAQLTDAKHNHKAIATPLDLSVERIKSSLSDMSYLDTLNYSKSAIFQAFGVHPSLFTGEASTMDNFRQARLSLCQNVVIPLMQEIVRNIQTVIFQTNDISEADYYLMADLSDIAVIKEVEVAKIIELHKNGLITENEAREEIGYNSVAGCDALRVPANMVPIGTDTIFTNSDDDL